MRAVLTYHSIDESRSPISVTAEEFAAHVGFLASGAVRVVSLRDLVEDESDEDDAVAITFDDAFENFESAALPALVDHGLPATLFVVSGRTGLTNAWGGRDQPGIPTLPLLDWDGLGRVHEAGVVLGAHTCTHPHLTTLDRADRATELEEPLATLHSRLGVIPDTLAYPYGDHDEALARMAAGSYKVACTTRLAAVDPSDDPLMIPRLDMFYFRDRGRLEMFGSPRFRAYLGFRRALRQMRSVVSGT